MEDPVFEEPTNMSNRAIWDVRQRHEWLTTPLKKKRFKRRSRQRLSADTAPANAPAEAGSAAADQANQN
jgi:hypothetical protein